MAAIVNCPQCGEEYLATTRECADCGVPLGVGAPAAQPEPEPVDELPPVSELTNLRTGSLGVVQGLSEMLMEAGITHRIEAVAPDDPGQRRRGDSLPYGVYVRAADEERAAAVDRAFMRRIMPDLPEDAGAPVAEGGCPACGTPVASDARECPDCGLALLEES
jgi:hypothetical protein